MSLFKSSILAVVSIGLIVGGCRREREAPSDPPLAAPPGTPQPAPPQVPMVRPQPPLMPLPMPTPAQLAVQPGVVAWTDYQPPTVPGWVREAPQDHGPVQGLIVSYNSPAEHIFADLYVYNRGIPGVRRDVGLMQQELANVAEGLQRAVQQGMYQAARPLTAPEPAPMGSAMGMRQRFAVTQQGVERQSEAYITTHREYFVKVRVTYHAASEGTAAQAVSALLQAIGSAAGG